MAEAIIDHADGVAFDRYVHILGDQGQSPQHQGLMPEDFARVLHDPRVIKTDVLTEVGGTDLVSVPQLAPIESYSWLNVDQYAAMLPEETARDAVRHLVFPEQLNPGSEVNDALIDLATKNGALVFDYPDDDPSYEDRVHSHLASLGIEVVEDVPLGEKGQQAEQTYYAGKLRLKRGIQPDKPQVGLKEAYESLVEKGMLPINAQDGPTYLATVNSQEAARIYPICEEAFKEVNTHPCRQGLTPEEFNEDVVSENDIVKFAYLKDGRVATMVMFGNNLKDYPWVDEAFFDKQFPVEASAEQIQYFPSLFTDPESQGDKYSGQLIAYINKILEEANNEPIIAFDCNEQNAWLPSMLEAVINATPEVEIEFMKLGAQKYKAWKLKPAT